MNWDCIESNWKQLKGNVTQQWGKLADDQLDVIAIKCERWTDKLQESYSISKSRNEAQKRLAAWLELQK